MSKQGKRLRTCTLAAVAAVAAAAAAALEPVQFVAGWEIEVPANAEVFDVPLAADVYAAAESLEQVAVLDADGEPQAFFRPTPRPAPPKTVTVPPLASSSTPDDAVADALYFDAGGALPVHAVTLAFSGGDGWARADVAAARSLDGPWTTVARGALFYSLSFEGRELESAPLAVGRREMRYWRLLPAAAPRGAVDLVLAFPEEQLRVAPTGPAPYLLAAGTLAEEAGPDATLASVWSSLPPADAVPLAALGPRRELGGAAALVPEQRFPWRTAALWAALIAGVLVALAMAVRLVREMSRQPS